jgi:hypothetical protein
MENIGNMIKEGAQKVWGAISEWFSGIWKGVSEKAKDVLGKVSEGWDWLKGKAGDALSGAKDIAGGVKDTAGGAWSGFTDLFADHRGDSPDAPSTVDDGIITKDGRVIKLSPDDNVYATKNDLAGVRDQEAQAAMPGVPRTPAEFTDAGIIAAIQMLTDVLKNKKMSTTVVSPAESMNFDQYRMADVLV